jgi:hypothetical protein
VAREESSAMVRSSDGERGSVGEKSGKQHGYQPEEVVLGVSRRSACHGGRWRCWSLGDGHC